MSTLDKILELLKEKGLKQKDLTDYLRISKGAFTDWKSGRINSYQKYIPQIAEFLGVSADYLLGTDSTQQKSPNNEVLKFALFGDIEVDDELLEEVKRFAMFAKQNQAEKERRKFDKKE